MSNFQYKNYETWKEMRMSDPFTGKKLTEILSEEAHTLPLLDKDSKSIILDIFTMLKKNMDKELKEIMKTLSHQTEYQWIDRNHKKEPN